MRALWPMLVVLVGCPGPDTDPDSDSGTDSDVDTGTDPDTDTDTEIDGTDEDRDSWTVENGDCDDDDPFVNPGWEERPGDNRDNDCDGRIDESFSQLQTWQVFEDGSGAPAIRSVSLLGDLGARRTLAGFGGGKASVELPGTGTWLVLDPASSTLYTTTSAASTANVVTFTAEDPWVREPFGIWGLGRDRAGVAYVTTANQLVAVQPDGQWSIVADWPCLDDVDGTVMCPVALTVVATTGDVALFGAFGGAGTWNETDGLVVSIPDDPENSTGEWDAARSDEQGRLYALGTTEIDGVATRGVFRWDRDTNAFGLRGPWVASNGAPPGGFTFEWRFGGFDIDTVRGEYYVTANVGTNRRAVYRIFDGDEGFAALLWPETFAETPGPADEGQEFHAISIEWNQD